MDYPGKTIPLKNGKSCLIRRGEERDAEILMKHWEITAGETRNLTRELSEGGMTLEEQRELIREKNGLDQVLNLLAFVDGQHAGNCAFNPVEDGSRMRHRCSVGIVLYRKFWGMGIGTALLSEILAAAKAAGYEQAELEVVSANAPAIGLYKKVGFEAVGTMPRALKYQDGTYADFLFMVKRLV
ncbi:MAG: GNAT family N-acetyltransferase [Oscillospiraceae bacterium]|nr:GNAT family N-acetyltransferase [Oscillospiraceae bacterium]